jgi:hypothetical protein
MKASLAIVEQAPARPILKNFDQQPRKFVIFVYYLPIPKCECPLELKYCLVCS